MAQIMGAVDMETAVLMAPLKSVYLIGYSEM